MTQNSNIKSSVYEHIQDLCKAPVLTEAETRNLLKEYAAGSELAKQKLIEHNMRFVVRVARRYNLDDDMLIDCIQEGALGLNRAIEKFDISTKWTLNTYSERWIRYRIERRIMKDKKVVYVPAHVAKKAHKVHRIIQKHEARNDGPIDLEAVAVEAKEPLDFVRKAFDLNQSEMSLDVPLGGSNNDSWQSRLVPKNSSSGSMKKLLFCRRKSVMLWFGTLVSLMATLTAWRTPVDTWDLPESGPASW